MVLNGFQKQLIERARVASETKPACVLCGESHGGLFEVAVDVAVSNRNSIAGKAMAHALCIELSKRCLPPPVWPRCTFCHGLGTIPISSVGPVNPSGVTMARWAPKCETCGGAGHTGGDVMAQIAAARAVQS